MMLTWWLFSNGMSKKCGESVDKPTRSTTQVVTGYSFLDLSTWYPIFKLRYVPLNPDSKEPPVPILFSYFIRFFLWKLVDHDVTRPVVVMTGEELYMSGRW